MNVVNITLLQDQLTAMGLEDCGGALLKRMCFRLPKFSFLKSIDKGLDTISFSLFFEKQDDTDAYVFVHFDAMLGDRPPQQLTEVGKDTEALDNEMARIDWKAAFAVNNGDTIVLGDKKTWEHLRQVHSVVTSLLQLERTEPGKRLASHLKQKHWVGPGLTDLMGMNNSASVKSEISQRFFVQAGQVIVTVDEAYRFLQNKRFERQLQEKKKQKNPGEGDKSPQRTSRSGRNLQKRRNRKKAATQITEPH